MEELPGTGSRSRCRFLEVRAAFSSDVNGMITKIQLLYRGYYKVRNLKRAKLRFHCLKGLRTSHCKMRDSSIYPFS